MKSYIKLLIIIFTILSLFPVLSAKADAAYLNITGFETGDASELAATSGTYSIQSTTKRTGTYALRTNPSASTSYGQIQKIAADGSSTVFAIGGGTSIYGAFYWRRANAPGVQTSIARVMTNNGTEAFAIDVDTSGNLHAYWRNSSNTRVEVGTSQATSINTWYLIEFQISGINISGGTAGWKINGTSVSSGSYGQNTSATTYSSVRFGVLDSTTADFYFDDIAISDSGYIGAGQVNNMVPNVKNTGSWTGGYEDLDEIPHDGDTTRMYLPSNIGSQQWIGLQSAAQAGITNTASAVKAWSILRSLGGLDHFVGLKSLAGYNADTSTFVPGTAYEFRALISEDPPGNATQYTTSELDGVDTKFARNVQGTTSYTTAAGLMVWSPNIVAPTITTPTKTNIAVTTATLGGNVTSDGGASITGRGVCVGTSVNPALGGTCFSTTGTTGVFTVGATGLTQNTLYHYRAYATNSVGTSYTTDDTFTTLQGTPTVTTSAAGSYAQTSIVLNSIVNPNAASTNVSYLWGTSNVACSSLPNTLAGPTGLTGSSNISPNATSLLSLTADTKYYFCVMATNANGTTYGSVLNFTTNSVPGAYTYMDAGSVLGGGSTDCNDNNDTLYPGTGC